MDTKVFIISIASETSLDGFLEICVIMREFLKKKFFRNADFWSYGDYAEKNSAFWKKRIPQNCLEIINVGTKQLQKHIFFKNFISKIFRN